MSSSAPHGGGATGTTRQRPLAFSGDRVRARVVDNARDLKVSGRAVVVNPTLSRVLVGETPRKGIPPLSSTVLVDTTVEAADRLVVLETAAGDAAGIVEEPGWRHFADIVDAFPADTPLWRSEVDEIGTVAFDPTALLVGDGATGATDTFRITVNLWFAPAGTACAIHNQHDFIEVHSQILGRGRMQKFRDRDEHTLYEDLLMSPGYTTPDPFCLPRPDGGFDYPWHQYHADTDAVWLAVEYHRAK